MESIFSPKTTPNKTTIQKRNYQKDNFTETPIDNAPFNQPEDCTKRVIADHIDRGRIAIFIDGANLFYAASQLGIEIDYTKLLTHLTVGGRLLHAFFYTGFVPENEKQHKFLHWMQRSGFRVITKAVTQSVDGSRKANLDVEIAVDMMRLAEYFDTAILVSGDGDFAYVVNTLSYLGVRVEVVGLRSMTSDQLINVADCYTDLGAIAQEIQRPVTADSFYLAISNTIE